MLRIKESEERRKKITYILDLQKKNMSALFREISQQLYVKKYRFGNTLREVNNSQLINIFIRIYAQMKLKMACERFCARGY